MCTKHAGSQLNAIAQMKCPRCRRGKLFSHSLFSVKKFQEMHKTCPVCGINFEPETGFYWGAMYVSYAITVAICVTVSVALSILFDDLNINVYIGVIVTLILLLVPLNFRLSRTLLLHTISPYKYDASFKNIPPAQEK